MIVRCNAPTLDTLAQHLRNDLQAIDVDRGALDVSVPHRVRLEATDCTVADEAGGQLLRLVNLPPGLSSCLTPEEWAQLVGGRLKRREGPSKVRVYRCGKTRIVGFSRANTIHLPVADIASLLTSTLPAGMRAGQVQVGWCQVQPTDIDISLFSPSISTEPRVGDVLNGGVHLRHSPIASYPTTVQCFIRRLACTNGMTTHICVGESHARSKRLAQDRHSLSDQRDQIARLLRAGWTQVEKRVQSVERLLTQPPADDSFLARYRTRFSLNNRVLRGVRSALAQDELPPSRTLFDLVNAISRVATHDMVTMTPRVRQTLLRFAGELAAGNSVEKCHACGSWVSGHRREAHGARDLHDEASTPALN